MSVMYKETLMEYITREVGKRIYGEDRPATREDMIKYSQEHPIEFERLFELAKRR